MRRSERLFAMAEYLRGRRTGVTAETLAERFGMTMRTVYRDLASLKVAELPLVAERGRGGGYALDRAYSLPPVNFSAREAAVLISAGTWLHQMRVIPFTRTLGTALDKVRAALSTSAQRELLTRLASLEYVGVPARDSDKSVRDALESAWFENRTAIISYRSASGAHSQRRVRIRHVVMSRTETLLNCTDLDKNEERQFRLDQIVSARVEAEGRQ